MFKQYDVNYPWGKKNKKDTNAIVDIDCETLRVFHLCAPTHNSTGCFTNEAYVLAFVNKWKLWTKSKIHLGG